MKYNISANDCVNDISRSLVAQAVSLNQSVATRVGTSG